MLGNLSAHDVRSLLGDSLRFEGLARPIAETFDFTRPLYTCTARDTLASVLQLLEGYHIHRVYLLTPKRRVKCVISLREVIAQFVVWHR